MLARTSIFVFFLVGLVMQTQSAAAVGQGPGGVDLLHVPMAWCVVEDSPAEANPNLAGDTTTDALLWRRHERPTDNIYINTAGITFRSAINNAWNVLDFPILTDPDTTLGQPGDMRGDDVNNFGAEFNQLINDCDDAYANLGRANIGVTAVNAGLFHDGAGNYVTVIGWGGCTRSLANPNVCATPYDGRIAVIDNIYLHPASPDRRWPADPATPGDNIIFVLTDPVDQLVGHELGHALGLDHRTNAMALMNPSQQDNDGDGQTDNIALTAAEIADVRASALLVPGLETDPPGRVEPGQVIADRITDRDQRIERTAFDLASVRVVFDKSIKTAYIQAQLGGLITKENATYWFFLDGDPAEGMSAAALKEIGAPISEFPNADVVVRADVRNQKISARAFSWVRGKILQFPRVIADVQRLIMYPHISPARGKPLATPEPASIYDVISIGLPQEVARIVPNRSFFVQVASVRDEKIIDWIGTGRPEEGGRFILTDPAFPHCFVKDKGLPGDVVIAEFNGLVPNRPVHALIGPREVARGPADARGAGKIDLRIPADLERPGPHLVTIGTDNTALTADCVVHVAEVGIEGKEEPRDATVEFLKSHEDLLRRQQRLIEKFGELLEKFMAGQN